MNILSQEREHLSFIFRKVPLPLLYLKQIPFPDCSALVISLNKYCVASVPPSIWAIYTIMIVLDSCCYPELITTLPRSKDYSKCTLCMTFQRIFM